MLFIVFILMPVSIILAFQWAPPAEILGESSRIIYFHVPLAIVSTIAFMISGILSIVYLYASKRKLTSQKAEYHSNIEEKAYNSACIGMVFTVLTIITGSIWAKISWGTYWNWDPRETSIIILFLIYIAYFSLRSALEGNPGRGRLTSVYLIFAMLTVPFLIFVIPRVYASLHPDPIINPDRQIHLEFTMRAALIISMISFCFLYIYLFSLANRISVLIADSVKK